jgi:hypothetical protein
MQCRPILSPGIVGSFPVAFVVAPEATKYRASHEIKARHASQFPVRYTKTQNVISFNEGADFAMSQKRKDALTQYCQASQATTLKGMKYVLYCSAAQD